MENVENVNTSDGSKDATVPEILVSNAPNAETLDALRRIGELFGIVDIWVCARCRPYCLLMMPKSKTAKLLAKCPHYHNITAKWQRTETVIA
jgi:hypothetical protein